MYDPLEKQWYYVVAVKAETEEQADKVMRERLDHDEDYGFSYEVSWGDSP